MTTASNIVVTGMRSKFTDKQMHDLCRVRANDSHFVWEDDDRQGYIRYEFKDGSDLLVAIPS